MRNIPLLELILGLVLLLMGRQLFWLFVGVMGFFAGFRLGTALFPRQRQALIPLLALGIGALGTGAALLLQRVAFVLAGMLAGGYVAGELSALRSPHPPPDPWAAYGVGAILGAVAGLLLADWAIMALSALGGAAMVAESIPASRTHRALLLAALTAGGFIYQAVEYAGT